MLCNTFMRGNHFGWFLVVLTIVGIARIFISFALNSNLHSRRRKTIYKINITTTMPCNVEFKDTVNREKRFICIDLVGGVGNSMYIFASAHGMASRVNKTVLISKSNSLINYFRIKAQVVDFCVCGNAEYIHEYQSCTLNKRLLNLTGRKNYHPGTYLQSWKYFEHVANDIREQYTFPEDIRHEALTLIKINRKAFQKRILQSRGNHDNVSSQPVVTIGVHVRRGDLLLQKAVDFGYRVAPSQYFKNAMTYFRRKYNNPLFLVCSEDLEWCRQNIVGSDVMYMDNNSFIVDMAILSHCSHTIISVGTFGWWSAFLSSGETIYYKHPAQGVYREHFSDDYMDYFYPGWIGME